MTSPLNHLPENVQAAIRAVMYPAPRSENTPITSNDVKKALDDLRDQCGVKEMKRAQETTGRS